MSIIKTLSVGNGDMFYINHNSSNFTVIDCFLSDENKEKLIGQELLRNLERMVFLQIIDSKWKDHLYAMYRCIESEDIFHRFLWFLRTAICLL